MTRRRGGLRTTERLMRGARHRPVDQGPPAPPRDPYVRIRLIITLVDEDGDPVGRVERVASLDRTGWDALPPDKRREVLDDLATQTEVDHVESEWAIDDPVDFLSTHIDIEQQQGE